MLTTAWRPNNGPVVDGQIFAIGDVHGQAEALQRLLDHIAAIQPAGKQRDIIFLGDLIDRGPENLRTIDLAMDADQICDRRFILPGNHELMMLRAEAYGLQYHDTFMHWFENGGHAVVDEVCPNTKAQVPEILEALRNRMRKDFIELMMTGPTYLREHRIMFIHAGLLPGVNTKNFLNAKRLLTADRYHWAWIRDEFIHHKGGWDNYDVDLVVHGHTNWTYAPLDYAGDYPDLTATHRRINLDAGAAVIPQVAAVEFVGDKHRLHIAEAPSLLPL